MRAKKLFRSPEMPLGSRVRARPARGTLYTPMAHGPCAVIIPVVIFAYLCLWSEQRRACTTVRARHTGCVWARRRFRSNRRRDDLSRRLLRAVNKNNVAVKVVDPSKRPSRFTADSRRGKYDGAGGDQSAITFRLYRPVVAASRSIRIFTTIRVWTNSTHGTNCFLRLHVKNKQNVRILFEQEKLRPQRFRCTTRARNASLYNRTFSMFATGLCSCQKS